MFTVTVFTEGGNIVGDHSWVVVVAVMGGMGGRSGDGFEEGEDRGL